MLVTKQQAVQKLKHDDVVAIPTETVYGLAASIQSQAALEKVFRCKKRPLFDPLIVHVASTAEAQELSSEWPRPIQVLTNFFWPGPLTVVVAKSEKVDSLITSGHETVALRCPAHPLAREVILAVGVPLAAPSANLFGRTSPTTAQHVEDEFGGQIAVLDGGPCEVGIESTVVRYNRLTDSIEVLRPGIIHADKIRDLLEKEGLQISVKNVKSEIAPGHLENHYQPSIPLVIMDQYDKLKLSKWLKENVNVTLSDCVELKLPNEAILAARILYAELRRLSQSSARAIFYEMSIDWLTSDWAGLRDRLSKASTVTLVHDGL